jgi:hypothetical protein
MDAFAIERGMMHWYFFSLALVSSYHDLFKILLREKKKLHDAKCALTDLLF